MSDPETPIDPAGDDDDEGRFVAQSLLALDGLLGAEEEAALRARLAADVEKRRLFVDLCLRSQALSEVFSPQRPDVAPGDRADLEASGPRLVDEFGGTAIAPKGGASRPPRRPWLPWTIAAAACILLALTQVTVSRRRPAVAPPRPEAVAESERDRDRARPAGDNGRGLASSHPLALMTRLDLARWEPGDGPPPAAGELLAARRLRLRSGRVVVTFLSGVVMTLGGPADVDLESIDRVFCRLGKLRARVPEGAEGFVVASPGSAVVDMGTEFGLNVEADGRSRVMVFEGLAEAALLDPAGSPERTQLVERSKAFQIDPRTHRIAAAGARPEEFVAAPDLPVPSLVLDPGYADAVLESRPRGYWRFESSAGGAVANEVPGGPPLRVTGPVAIDAGSAGNGCASFKAGESGQFLATDAPWELPREPGHAIELWFLSEGISHASLVGLFPNLRRTNMAGQRRYVHSFFLELTARDRQSLYKPASVRFLHRWPLDYTIGNNLMSERVYAPRRWHHAVAQKNGDRLELYFDGVSDLSMPLDPDHPTLSCHLVVGRRTPDPLDLHDIRAFVGRLDEFAIYDHPLSAEEVRRHFSLATPKDRAE